MPIGKYRRQLLDKMQEFREELEKTPSGDAYMRGYIAGLEFALMTPKQREQLLRRPKTA